MNIGTQPSFTKRVSIAAINILTPLCFSIAALYYAVRELSGGEPWLIDILGYILPWLLLLAVILLPAAILLRRPLIMRILTSIPIAFLSSLTSPCTCLIMLLHPVAQRSQS